MQQLLSKLFKGDRIIWTVIGVLFIFSVLAVYSSVGTLAYKFKAGNTTFYLFRHCKFLIAGIAITYFIHRIHYRYYFKLSQMLILVAAPLLLITLASGVNRNDAARWFSIFGIEFQTSDFAKLALIMFIARILSINQSSRSDFQTAYRYIIISAVVICGLILPANFSTAALLFTTVFLMMFIGRLPIRYLLNTIGLVLVGISLIIVMAYVAPDTWRVSTWQKRIENFFDSDDGKIYEQANQSKIAIATGGLVGKGPGNSTQRNFLPQPYSDFIFAIIIEEYGSIGGTMVVLLYLSLLFRTGMIVRRCQRTFPAFLAVGLTINLVFQALVNMAVAVGLLPVTGQPLPFISWGGTSILFTSVAFGIILSVSRYIDEPDTVKAE